MGLGVCGKTPNTAALQDLLMELSKGISTYARRARDLGAAYTDRAVDRFVMERYQLFTLFVVAFCCCLFEALIVIVYVCCVVCSLQ